MIQQLPAVFNQTSPPGRRLLTHTTTAQGQRKFWHYCRKVLRWQGIAKHCQHTSCYFQQDQLSSGKVISIPRKEAYSDG